MCCLVLYNFNLPSPTQHGSILTPTLLTRILAAAWLTNSPLQFKIKGNMEFLYTPSGSNRRLLTVVVLQWKVGSLCNTSNLKE